MIYHTSIKNNKDDKLILIIYKKYKCLSLLKLDIALYIKYIKSKKFFDICKLI